MKEDESGTVSIMFNYNTEDEKTWFDGIEKLALVSYDEQKRTLNADLQFDMKKNVLHGKGHVGELEIPMGQTNFRNNGRYYVRVTSSAGETTLVPIHVVNEKKPKLTLKETAQSGKNLHFAVSDLVYGITSPVERVTLKTPNGDIEELQKFDDWYLLSQDLFVLYNDKTDHFATKGKYTLTIYANGFQTFSKNDWDDYVDQCEDEKTENDRMLPYAEYCERGEIYASRPAAAKEVLEDGLLGDIQQSSSFIPKDDTEHGTETDLSLKAQYDEDAEAFTATKDDAEKYYADATFELEGSGRRDTG